jgi:hypothetical protein
MALDGEHVYAHGSEVHVVKTCLADDGPDLIALGGAHSVVVLSYVRSPGISPSTPLSTRFPDALCL